MIKPAVHQVITEALSHVFVEKHRYSFRGSSLPYCPVHDCLVRCQSKTNSLPPNQIKFVNQLAMDIGTTIHALLQKTMTERGTIFGRWKCKICSTVYDFSKGPVKCPGPNCHNKICEYVELEVRDPESGFSGHVDCLIPTVNPNEFILVDFKTIYRKKLSKLELDHKHRLQVFAYKHMLQKPPYSLKIVGQAVVYFPREDMSLFEIIEMEDDDLSEAEFVRYTRQKAHADQVMVTGKLSDLKGLCTTRSDQPYCPYNPYCFGPDRDMNLDQVWSKANPA